MRRSSSSMSIVLMIIKARYMRRLCVHGTNLI
jgi:hypothetical protein